MAKFGVVPREVPAQRTSKGCAPKFVAAVQQMLASLEGGRAEMPFEWLRTPERQTFLHGFGRVYDDGRGRVTNAATHLTSWHGFGLAVDVVEKDATPWNAPISFWQEIGDAAEATGVLAWGGRWLRPDLPHVQWKKCPKSPTDQDRALYLRAGVEAVWRKYDAHADPNEEIPMADVFSPKWWHDVTLQQPDGKLTKAAIEALTDLTFDTQVDNPELGTIRNWYTRVYHEAPGFKDAGLVLTSGASTPIPTDASDAVGNPAGFDAWIHSEAGANYPDGVAFVSPLGYVAPGANAPWNPELSTEGPQGLPPSPLVNGGEQLLALIARVMELEARLAALENKST